MSELSDVERIISFTGKIIENIKPYSDRIEITFTDNTMIFISSSKWGGESVSELTYHLKDNPNHRYATYCRI